ncbi:FkbM family methyltransferase [Cyanobium sp. WKJ7-Wakatipu]|uniref:FkbM family methyltransferase n=1 Tax=Cyanobium sp. WKJ7-Wakatipu TaxID=2823726 RepID=UPI0020CD4539|nr:FkbM family methyltransferase [Cyanobium sp. WKJ7-Wakatipu]MCP9783287.1 FkbM family methyltransferase [Cyanobium sp. WKJ7-Wakatipu]
MGAAIGTIAGSYKCRLSAHCNEYGFQIYCFEPLSRYFESLKAKFSGDPRVICENIALSDAKGFANFFQGELPFSSSLLPFSNVSEGDAWGEGIFLRTQQVVSVPAITLDAYCLDNSISHVNILKIDARGGEALILQGCERLMRNQCIDLIYLEVILEATCQGQPTVWDLMARMSKFGHELIDIYDAAKVRGKLMQMDALFASAIFTQNHRLPH